MIPRFLNIAQDRKFVGFHAVHIEVTCPGHEILRIGVLPGKTVRKLVTAIVDIFAVDKIKF